jgi:hypothetical protein
MGSVQQFWLIWAFNRDSIDDMTVRAYSPYVRVQIEMSIIVPVWSIFN